MPIESQSTITRRFIKNLSENVMLNKQCLDLVLVLMISKLSFSTRITVQSRKVTVQAIPLYYRNNEYSGRIDVHALNFLSFMKIANDTSS